MGIELDQVAYEYWRTKAESQPQTAIVIYGRRGEEVLYARAVELAVGSLAAPFTLIYREWSIYGQVASLALACSGNGNVLWMVYEDNIKQEDALKMVGNLDQRFLIVAKAVTEVTEASVRQATFMTH